MNVITLPKNKRKISPIIQTQGMKAKQAKNDHESENNFDKECELEKLNNIDKLRPHEIVDGEIVNQINHDGLEISINRSDNEFEEEEE